MSASAQTSERSLLLLADFVLLIHFAFVLFVVLGLLVIWIGHFLSWKFVRNFILRALHLLAMGFVLLETLAGVICPLTTWEHNLRIAAGSSEAYQESFMQYWVHRLMFFDLPPVTFTIIYTLFFILLAGSLWWVPPRRPKAFWR